ncbi:GntP family permease [Clostridium tarantellae]|uniref:GntP family permease n=1 Tax=Clostridium tarantellae TaxID=39493 RepID=A0A6I1MHR5_9CLOT|nr:SLC13 family permease [Clostridium tarantellae]MPQ43076.1 GntP family permease [Clostridium tarantellae]
MEVSVLGAVIALIIAIFLIIKRVNPVYALITGSLIGGILSGIGFSNTIKFMIKGSEHMIPAILRVLTAGVLAGVLIKSGAAIKISEVIIDKIGESKVLIALTTATMILTAIGVFSDVAVITIAPIALVIAKKTRVSRMSILLAMVGGSKAGNIISPNPNSISVAENLGVDLTSVMIAGIFPAILGLILTCILSEKLKRKGSFISDNDNIQEVKEVPKFFPAIFGPLVTIVLLMLKPLINLQLDPLIVLPIGGICGAIAMGKWRNINEYTTFGIKEMSNIAILLVGTGALSGIIENSTLKYFIINGVNKLNLPSFSLAPISSLLLSAITGSTTSTAAIASSIFGETIVKQGVSPVAVAVMIQAGAIALDNFPQGSCFHITGNSVNMDMKERLRLIPYELVVGLGMSIISIIIFGIVN